MVNCAFQRCKGKQNFELDDDIAGAMAPFQGSGGLHRDVKPENILIKTDKIFIANFGLANQGPHSSSNVASVAGTEVYMSSEQGKDQMYGRPSDVFAMGCIFLKFLTFGENISLNYFQKYRVHWGSQACPDKNCGYRHNLDAVSRFISTHLRNNPITSLSSISFQQWRWRWELLEGRSRAVFGIYNRLRSPFIFLTNEDVY